MATLVANDLFVTSAVQDHDLGLAHGITPSALRRALEAAAREGRRVGAVLVVRTATCSNSPSAQPCSLLDNAQTELEASWVPALKHMTIRA